MLVDQITLVGFSEEGMEDLSKLSDEELLERSLENPGAFEFLVARYQNQFLARAQAVVGSRDLAEDIVQDAFIRIYRFASRFRGEAGSFHAWSLTILMNVARTHYHKAARERGTTVILDPEHYESLADPANFREDDEDFAQEVVERALEEVPSDMARIMRLAFIEELPYKEIAKIEQLSVAAVKTRVFRAKALIRTIIGKFM